MAKKQTIASEIGSALGAAAARAEQFIAKPPAKPAPKRTAAAKHSKAQTNDAVSGSISGLDDVSESSSPAGITREEIAEQAYLYWEARGFQGGNPDEDWTRAEEELKQRHQLTSAASA